MLALACALALSPADMAPMSLYDIKVKTIKNEEYALSKHKGKVILFVNTASKCGLTPQYKELQAIYDIYKDKGLVVLGFPANDFGKQEPGTNAEIAAFCHENYGVTFPMHSKITVKGADKHPLYQFLLNATDDQGEIKWNFEKFLASKDGVIVERFAPQIKPSDAKVTSAIERELSR